LIQHYFLILTRLFLVVLLEDVLARYIRLRFQGKIGLQ